LRPYAPSARPDLIAAADAITDAKPSWHQPGTTIDLLVGLLTGRTSYGDLDSGLKVTGADLAKAMDAAGLPQQMLSTRRRWPRKGVDLSPHGWLMYRWYDTGAIGDSQAMKGDARHRSYSSRMAELSITSGERPGAGEIAKSGQ
jgi:hypothetical protein